MSYVVVIEKAESNWSAYVPDLPGCIATGRSRIQVLSNIQKAIQMHVDGLREDGLALPRPAAKAVYVPSSASTGLIAARKVPKIKAGRVIPRVKA